MSHHSWASRWFGAWLAIAMILGLSTPARAAADEPAPPLQPLLSYMLSVDGTDPNAVELNTEVELESHLQQVGTPWLLPIHYRFSVECADLPMYVTANPDRTILVPPPVPPSPLGPKVKVEEDVTVPWDCVRQPAHPITGYHGWFSLETGGTEGQYHAKSVVFFKIKLPDLATDRSQIEAKYKHAKDFGVTTDRGAQGFIEFDAALHAFMQQPGVIRVTGTYTRMPGVPVILNYDPQSKLIVIQRSADGSFVSGWKMSDAQLHYVKTIRTIGGD